MSARAARLRRLATSLGAGAAPSTVAESAAGTPPPDGVVAVVRHAATTARVAAHELRRVGGELEAVLGRGLPAGWAGSGAGDGAAAGARLRAAAARCRHGATTLERAGACLATLASRLAAAQRRDRAARERILTASGNLDAAGRDAAVSAVTAAIDDMAAAAEQAENAGHAAAGLLRTYAAAATAARLEARLLATGDRLVLAGVADAVGPVLTAADAARAASRLDAWDVPRRRQVTGLLDAARSDVERAWLLKALAAGTAVPALTSFATAIRGRGAAWLCARLRPLDPQRFDAGRAVWCGARLAQSTPTTCGSMSLLLNRALHDPVYALSLATAGGDMASRLAAEERRIHGETNRLRIEDGVLRWWPSQLGTAPSHAANWLSTRTGTAYEVSWDAYPSRTPTADNVDRGVTTASRGDPALLLIGNGYPDHYVMVVGRDESGVRVYNPAGGKVVTVPPERLHQEPLTRLNRSKLYAVITAR